MLMIDAKPSEAFTDMDRVRNRNLFPAPSTFQPPRNTRCNICCPLRAGNRIRHARIYRLFQPFRIDLLDVFQTWGLFVSWGTRGLMLGRIGNKVKMRSCTTCSRSGCSYLFKQSGKPVHNVERQLSIIDSGNIHAERHFVGSRDLR